jgi:hypothetical protein
MFNSGDNAKTGVQLSYEPNKGVQLSYEPSKGVTLI